MKFLILFDNTNLLYFPGQFLSGRVLLELQEDTPALGKIFIAAFCAKVLDCVTKNTKTDVIDKTLRIFHSSLIFQYP